MTDPAERAQVTERLGREPRAPFRVVVRDGAGAPVVIRNAPFLDDGTPLPTTYWLVDPDLSRRVARLEADGGVRARPRAPSTRRSWPRRTTATRPPATPVSTRTTPAPARSAGSGAPGPA